MIGVLKILILGIVSLGCLWWMVTVEDLMRLGSLTPLQVIGVMISCQAVYLASGLELAVIAKRTSGIQLDIKDKIFLPLTMNLWSVLIPFQGALIYLSMLFKYKYKAEVKDAIFATVISYLFSLAFTGVVGLGIYFNSKELNSSIFSRGAVLVCVLFVFSPAIIYVISSFLSRRSSLLKILPAVISRNIDRCQKAFSVMKDIRFTMCLLWLFLLHVALSTFMFAFAGSALGFHYTWHTILLFTLLMRLTIIIKITPGNIGVQEVLGGGLFAILGLDPAPAILTLVLIRLITFLLMATVGVWDTFINASHIPFNRIINSMKGHRTAPASGSVAVQ